MSKLALKLALGIALLVVVFWAVGMHHSLDAIRSADLGFLAIAFLWFLMISFFEGGKLYAAFRNIGVALGACTRMVFEGLFYCNFLPSILGADVYKVYVLHRTKRQAAAGLALVTCLRVLSMGFSALIAGVYLMLYHEKLSELIRENPFEFAPSRKLVVAMVAVPVVFCIVFLISNSNRVAKIRSGLGEHWNRGKGALRDLNSFQLAWILFFTLGVIAMRTFSNQYLLFSLGEDLPLFDVYFVTTVVTLISVLPITFASLGVREGAITLLLVIFGVSVGASSGIAILNRIFLWLASIPGGLSIVFERRKAKGADVAAKGGI